MNSNEHGSQQRSGFYDYSSSSYLSRRPPPRTPYDRLYAEQLASYLQQSFLPSVLPTTQEYDAKEQTRRELEALANEVYPGAKLVPFGSIASGLSLRDADMDLCCFQPRGPGKTVRSAAEMVEILGALIREKTQITVKTLPRARIPIIKLTIPPSAAAPFGMSCDIGFENRMALENTRLLLTYAMVDPRLRTMVLFIKVWTKRRKVNNPYLGTLSSYAYVLLVIFFLTNIRQPPVLPNLQLLPPPRDIPQEEREFEGHDIYFFDDLELLNRYWTSSNNDNVGELLISFFQYFAREFRFHSDVVSIRTKGGILHKESKGWHRDRQSEPESHAPWELNRLCIEDPFTHDYNVARTVTADGVYTIRGEFMRAARILGSRMDRIPSMIQELCEERPDILYSAPSQSYNRRRSAPSPRIIPLNLANAPPVAPIDFRLWAGGNPQGTMYPIRHPGSHQLNPTPFGHDESEEAAQQQQQTQEELVSPVSVSSSSSLSHNQQSQQPLQQTQQQTQQQSQQQLSTSPTSTSQMQQYLPPTILHPQLQSTSPTSTQQQQPLFYLSPSNFAYQAYLQQQQQQQSSSSSYYPQENYSNYHSRHNYSSHRGHHNNHYHNHHHYNNNYNHYGGSNMSSSSPSMRRRSQIIENTDSAVNARERRPSSRLERRSSWDGSTTSTYPIMSLSSSSPSNNPQDQTATAPASPSMIPHRNIVFGNFEHALTPNSAMMAAQGGVGYQSSSSCPSQTMTGVNFVSSPTSSTSGISSTSWGGNQKYREESVDVDPEDVEDLDENGDRKSTHSHKQYHRHSRQKQEEEVSEDDEANVTLPSDHLNQRKNKKNKDSDGNNSNNNNNTHMIRPDVHGETISFGAIQVVRRSRQGDIKMAEKLRRRARGSMDSGSTTDTEDQAPQSESLSQSLPITSTTTTTHVISSTISLDGDEENVDIEISVNVLADVGDSDDNEEDQDDDNDNDDSNKKKLSADMSALSLQEVDEENNQEKLEVEDEENLERKNNDKEEKKQDKTKKVVVIVDADEKTNEDEKEEEKKNSDQRRPKDEVADNEDAKSPSSSSSSTTLRKIVSPSSSSLSSLKDKKKSEGKDEKDQQIQIKSQKGKPSSSHSPSSSHQQDNKTTNSNNHNNSITSISNSSSSLPCSSPQPSTSSSSSSSSSPHVEPKTNGVIR